MSIRARSSATTLLRGGNVTWQTAANGFGRQERVSRADRAERRAKLEVERLAKLEARKRACAACGRLAVPMRHDPLGKGPVKVPVCSMTCLGRHLQQTRTSLC